MGDIDIARSVKLDRIQDVAEKFGIKEEELELYGKYKAKVSNDLIKRVQKNKDGKLILVTSNATRRRKNNSGYWPIRCT